MAPILAALVPAAAAAAPSNVEVTQEGTSFRVTWTPGVGDPTTGQVEISSRSDFAAGADTYCGPVWEANGSTLVRCPIAFSDTVYVRVRPFTLAGTVRPIPAAQFDFTPVGPQGAGTVRNRQTVHCALDAAQWQRIDASTAFKARIVRGSSVQVERTLSNSPFILPGFNQIDYPLTGADVGQEVRCEIAAANGVYASTSVQRYSVEHAQPNEMNPGLMLATLTFPNYIPFSATKGVSLSKAAKKAGALRSAKRAGALMPWSEIVTAATVYSTPAKADAGVRKTYCKALRKAVKRASTKAFPKSVLQCGKLRLAGARRAYGAVTAGYFFTDTGVLMITAQRLILGSGANTGFAVTFTSTSVASQRKKTLNEVFTVGNNLGATLADAAARE